MPRSQAPLYQPFLTQLQPPEQAIITDYSSRGAVRKGFKQGFEGPFKGFKGPLKALDHREK